ncbi:MAG: glycosyltransferase family 2 protein [bacterium]|nr:glycosyltransferase family 2 protein [bacterium]
MHVPVTIVVPVYGDWPSLEDCIASLKENVDMSLHTVILVNDCGPAVELMKHNIKNAIKDQKGFQYFRNPKNLGFIGTCNRAVFELDSTNNDILLLNSDTKVTSNFIEEMLAVLYTDIKHGVVSPRSNNATIATIPLSSAPQKGIDMKKSFAIYQKLKKQYPPFYEVPVGHGFCMLIRRSLIKKYGLFDTVFGKGYGEEVDFCMRIAKDGYKCLLANHAYVFHLEARSFSLEKKAQLLEVNNKILWKRYPNYRQQVRDYMDMAVPRETALERRAKIFTASSLKQTIKNKLRKSPRVRRVAKNLHAKINRKA